MNKKRPTSGQRKAIWERAQGCCEYCRSQAEFDSYTLTVEHIIPWNRNGMTELSNLALSCMGCNNHKATKVDGLDPETGEVVPLYHPRMQAWYDHFAWSDDFDMIIGLTPTGRATVVVLHLNRRGVVNL